MRFCVIPQGVTDLPDFKSLVVKPEINRFLMYLMIVGNRKFTKWKDLSRMQI